MGVWDNKIMVKIKLQIQGMHCGSCAKMIELELEDKVNKISVSNEKGIAEIDFDEKKISKAQIKTIIENIGEYKVK